MNVSHLSGCDGRHPARQACAIPSPDPAAPAIDIDTPLPPNLHGRYRPQLSIQLASSIFAIGVLSVSAALAVGFVVPALKDNAQTTGFGRPPDTDELLRTDSCEARLAAYVSRCVTVRFGSDTPFETTRAILFDEFARRDNWVVRAEGGDREKVRLLAYSKEADVCVEYLAHEPSAFGPSTEYTRKARQYKLIIDVALMEECSNLEAR